MFFFTTNSTTTTCYHHQELADSYSALITQLATKASSVIRTMDANDDLTFLRIRSKQHEILVAPDKEYSLIVIQNPTLD